ncbi:MAG: hypothetical protein AAF661_15105 [Pseudomonadota bacterium]|mgnify:CR=1 FL=1
MRGAFVRQFQIQREQPVDPVGANDFATEWVIVQTIRGKLSRSGLTEATIARGDAMIVRWKFACDGAHDLQQQDRLVGQGETVEVEALSKTSSGRRWEAICRSVET